MQVRFFVVYLILRRWFGRANFRAAFFGLCCGLAGMAVAAEPAPSASRAVPSAAAKKSSPPAWSQFQSGRYAHNGVSIPFRLLQPQTLAPGKRYPLVVFLHGSGERGFDNRRQVGAGVERLLQPEWRERFPAFVFVPQCPPNSYWGIPVQKVVEWQMLPGLRTIPMGPAPAQGKVAPDTLDLVLASVGELTHRYPIDPKRIYVVGFSMGGMAVFRALERLPHYFAGAIAISANGDPNRVRAYARTPIWLFHGEADANVAVEGSRRMAAALRAAGGAPRLTLYPKTAHNAWTPALSNPATWEWLFQQVRASGGR